MILELQETEVLQVLESKLVETLGKVTVVGEIE
jgi:hypothetical protein